MIKIFTLPCCPRCDIVKNYLKDRGIDYTEIEMDSAEGITDLRLAGCFAMEGPVLMHNDDEFLEGTTMFPDGNFNCYIVDGLVELE